VRRGRLGEPRSRAGQKGRMRDGIEDRMEGGGQSDAGTAVVLGSQVVGKGRKK
jgi:hypothetical protein